MSSKFKSHVVVVEDYLSNQIMVRMMLEKMGCSVDVASNGDREHCLAANMDNYISKPIRYVELEKILAEYLPSSK